MVSRNGQCRPCFIKKYLEWTLTDAELRAVPLGVLTTEQLKELRRQTRCQRDVKQVLRVLMVIAPKALTAHVTGEMVLAGDEQADREDEEATLYDPEALLNETDLGSEGSVRFNSDWFDDEAEASADEAMWRDIRGQHPDGEP